LVPFFTKQLSGVKGISTINARGNGCQVSHLPRAIQKSAAVSCLRPVSMNWEGLDAKNKQPFAFDLAGGGMLAFAGLWDGWKGAVNVHWLQSYTIITTDANELMAPVHNRMPVIPTGRLRPLARPESHRATVD